VTPDYHIHAHPDGKEGFWLHATPLDGQRETMGEATLLPSPMGLVLDRIYVEVPYREGGLGSALLEQAKRLSGGKLVLVVMPLGPHTSMSADKLTEWYMRHGFVRGEGPGLLVWTAP
jgi:GNAT superfamily N-acetyltransferase